MTTGGLFPKTARTERRDHPPLVAAGVAKDKYLSIVAVKDTQARLTIIVGGAARRPARAVLAASEGLSD